MSSSSADALVAQLERCADAAAASAHAAALVALLTQEEAAQCAAPADALQALSRVLVELGPQLSASGLADACTAVSVVLGDAVDEAPDRDALCLTAARGVCVAVRCGGADSLSEAAGVVALLASLGTPALRDLLRADAAPFIVAAMAESSLDSHRSACVALHYLTQDGAAAAIAAIPGAGAALGAALSASAAGDSEDARAAAAALAHVAADSQCAALLAPAASAAVAALEAHAPDASCARLLAVGIAKLADAGAPDARTPAACAAVARALALHRGVRAIRVPLLAALVAASGAEEQAALLVNGSEAAQQPFALETRASGIAGAGAGLFVARGEAAAGSVLALYPGEVWTDGEDPPASVAAGNEYLAASPGGGFADGSAAAVARAAAAAASRGAPELGARAAAQMANHPVAGCGPNSIFLELALPRAALSRAPAAAPGGEPPAWVLCLLAVQPLPRGAEVTVDYRIDAARAPAWYAPVAEHLALL